MSGLNWDELSAGERLIAEQAVLNLRELNKACRAAADGTVLAVAESLAILRGRELIRQTLEVSLQEEGREVKKRSADPDVRVRIEQVASWPQDTSTDHAGR